MPDPKQSGTTLFPETLSADEAQKLHWTDQLVEAGISRPEAELIAVSVLKAWRSFTKIFNEIEADFPNDRDLRHMAVGGLFQQVSDWLDKGSVLATFAQTHALNQLINRGTSND